MMANIWCHSSALPWDFTRQDKTALVRAQANQYLDCPQISFFQVYKIYLFLVRQDEMK